MRYINLLLTLTLRNVSIHLVLIAARVSECCCVSGLYNTPTKHSRILTTTVKKLEIKLPSIEDRCQTDLDFNFLASYFVTLTHKIRKRNPRPKSVGSK